jgi:hypothetical protein
MPIRLATVWGEQVKKKLELDLIRNRQEILWNATDGNTLTSAVFAGFYENSPLIVTGSITYTVAANGHIKTSFSILNIYRKPKAVMIGRTDIANELFTHQTERARKWLQDLTLRTPPGADPVAMPAIGSVEFSIENYPLVNIGNQMLPPLGGPIDAVRLKREGGIEWIQRKPNCPSD